MRWVLMSVLGLAVLLAAAAFGALNDQMVVVQYFLGSRELRLASLMALVFGTGCLIGLGLAGGGMLSLRLALKRSQAELAMKNKELNELRTLPIRDGI
ncbi:MAG: DUF1049 domain-containing protein [Gammaproteobacteria bacterium]|nr:DUF1049 domain-containing protein [Gammaproteobacteria bacterium]